MVLSEGPSTSQGSLQTTAPRGESAPRTENDQWNAEIGALETRYPDTAAQGLMLYSLLSKTLITHFEHATLNASGLVYTGSGRATGKATSGATLLGRSFDALAHVPPAGSQRASSTQTALQTAAEHRLTRNFVRQLNALASINQADTPRALDATVRCITHALAYRLALHHCAKPEPDVFDALKQAITPLAGTGDRSSAISKNYALRINDAIKLPETLSNAQAYVEPEARLEAVVTSLVAAALGGSDFWNRLLPHTQRNCVLTAQVLCTAHDDIIKSLVDDTPSTAVGQPTPTWRNTAITAHANATIEEALRRQAEWVRPSRAKLPALLDKLDITEPSADEIISPISRRLMDRTYGLRNAEQVMDAAERLDTRTQMKNAKVQHAQLQHQSRQLERRNEQLRCEVGTLRSELQILNAKPSDPAIGLLRNDLDEVTAQQLKLQPQVGAALRHTTGAQQAVQTLTTQVRTLQTAVDNLPAKEQVDAIARRVDTIDSTRDHLWRAARRLTQTVTTLEEKVQTLIDKPPDPAIGVLRNDLDAVTAQQSTLQPQVSAALRHITQAQEVTQTLTTQVQTLQTSVDNLPAKEQVDAIAQRVDTIATAKDHLRRVARRMTATVTTLGENVQTLIDKPPDPAIATLRGEVARVTTQQSLTQTSLMDTQRLAASAVEANQSFSQQITSLRAVVDALEHEVDAMDSRLDKIPVQEEYDALEQRIAAVNDEKNELIDTMQEMSEAAALLDREVQRTTLQPPDPVIALLRRDLDAVIARQAEIQANLTIGPRV